MAQLARKFEQNDEAEQKEYTGGGGYLPDGNYELEIESSKPADYNVEGELFVLDVVYNVRAPEEFEGRKIFDSYRLVNSKNAGWEKDENDRFTFMCKAIGHVGGVDDSEDLHLRPFVAKVMRRAYKKKTGEDGVANRVVYYYNPTKDDEPELGAFEDQPELKPAKARAASNDNKPAARPAAASQPAAKPAGNRPWGAKK